MDKITYLVRLERVFRLSISASLYTAKCNFKNSTSKSSKVIPVQHNLTQPYLVFSFRYVANDKYAFIMYFFVNSFQGKCV